jgi:hypothetical protein
MKIREKHHLPMKGRLMHGNFQLHRGHFRGDLGTLKFHLVGAKDQIDLLGP